MNKKAIIIDLDGATFDMIKPLAAEGRLPNLARLIEGGAHGTLKSTIPAITPCAYSSFITGRRPRNTGIFDFVLKRPGEKSIDTVNSGVLDGVPFWKIINHYGRKVGIVNLPMTYPVSPVDGFMIGCGLTAGAVDNRDFHHPSDIFSRNGFDPSTYILKPSWQTMRYKTPEEYRQEVLKMFEARSDLALRLIKDESWDFFMVHIHAIDWIQHSFWDKREIVADVYAKVDALIGEVTSLVSTDTNVIVMSDHGFGPTHRTLSLSKWLKREGFLATKDISFGELYGKVVKKFFPGPRSGARRLLDGTYNAMPGFVKSLMDSALTRGYELFPGLNSVYSPDYMKRIDWENTEAFTYGQIGAIYLNVGDDPERRRKTGEAITERLLDLTDETGEKLVDRVYTKEELYSGNHEDTAPDLLVSPRKVMYFHPDFDLKGIVSPPVHWRMGNHATDGVFIINGGDVREGEYIGPIDISDLMPTILYSMGLPALKGMDGRVNRGCFKEAFINTNNPGLLDDALFTGKKAERVDEDTEHIKRQLKGLGYI